MRRACGRGALAAGVATVLCAGLAGPVGPVADAEPIVSEPVVSGPVAGTAARADGPDAAVRRRPPNIVLVLIDDFSANLLATMPHARHLKRDGAWFPHAFVADSLCCPSRSAFLTGQYPHVNGVRTNTPGPRKHKPRGGWKAFTKHHDGKRTFANAINHRDGVRYRTAFQGKFLNGYKGAPGSRVPPGWTQWNAIVGGGYKQWDYTMTATSRRSGVHRVTKRRPYGSAPRAYGTSVLSRRADRFITDSRRHHRGRPYFLEIAPYSTHSRLKARAHRSDPLFPAAFRDRPGHAKTHGNCGRVKCLRLHASMLPGFNDPTADNAPRFDNGGRSWRWQNNTPMGRHARKVATKRLRDRARMAQSVDRMIGRIRRNAGSNTYIVVTSDNGFHLGQHRSRHGKGTAYDYDIRVPLIFYKKAAKPGNRLVPGPRPQVVSNVDLAPTIRQLAGVPLGRNRNGVSLVHALRHPHSAAGPRYAFVEHTKPNAKGPYALRDPDRQSVRGGTSMVPSYVAVRSAKALLIRYRNVERGRTAWEFYRYHPRQKGGLVERTNTYLRARGTTRMQNMKDALSTFTGCTGRTCRMARHPSGD